MMNKRADNSDILCDHRIIMNIIQGCIIPEQGKIYDN